MTVEERIARLVSKYLGRKDRTDPDHVWLVEFGLRVRKQTLREERERNRRVAAMFAKEPE